MPAAVTKRDTTTGCGNVSFNSITYTSNQIITNAIKNYLGCDSIIEEHHLVVLPTPKNFIIPNDTAVCLGQSFSVNGYTNYLWNTGETTSTINLNGLNKYWVEVTAANGCKGTDTLNVNYNKASYDSVVKVICFGDSVDSYKSTGIYRDTLINYLGCDSFKILHLTVLPAAVTKKDTTKGCDSVAVVVVPRPPFVNLPIPSAVGNDNCWL
jgi:hypothetical protein